MTNIILIGLRGSGKSQIGKRLSKTMKRKFIDTDREIERQSYKTIAKLIEKKGWNHFRKIEKYVVRRVSKEIDSIISTGGGAVIDKENAKALKKNGFIVYLKVPTELLAERLAFDETRPSLTKASTLKAEIEEVRAKREPIYLELADMVFEIEADSDDPKKDIKLNTSRLNLLLEEAREEFRRPD